MKHFQQLVTRLLIHRRIVATLAAMVAVLAICAYASGGAGPTTDVYAATRRIPAGTIIDLSFVQLVSVPTRLIPEGAITDTALLSDQMAAGPIPSGSILTGDHFVAGSLASPGMVIIPLTVSSQLSAILKPGDHVSVFFVDQASGGINHVSGLRVVTIPTRSGMFSSGDNYILVEVDNTVATQITAAASVAGITVAIE